MGCSIHVKDLQLNALGCEAESCQHEIRHILAEVGVDTTEIHLHRETRSDMCLSILPTRAATIFQSTRNKQDLISRPHAKHVYTSKGLINFHSTYLYSLPNQNKNTTCTTCRYLVDLT
jgi:hypothetical protein